MIRLTPISIDAAKQVYNVEVSERFCQPYCTTATIQPTVIVNYSIESTTLVDDVLFVRVKATGSAEYLPKGGCKCKPSSILFTEYFSVAFTGVTDDKATVFVEDANLVEPAFLQCNGDACGIATYNVVSITTP